MNDRIQELAAKIKKAREEYYNLSPDISDQEYDALLDELKLLAPDHEQVVSVGAPVPEKSNGYSVWEKVAHKIPMGSLNKANSEKEFEEWAEQAQTSDDCFVTHKIDGSSMELIYEEGKLVRCVTRGDGIIGEDVTFNISQVPNIPKTIQWRTKETIVRGEIVMTKKVFQEKYSESYANPRNTAAGKVRDKKGGGADCANLEFIAYWMIGGMSSKTMERMFEELQVLGFQTPSAWGKADMAGVKAIFTKAAATRDQVEYEIDGMVVSTNDLEHLDRLGDLHMKPRGQIAWKFDPAMGITTVLDIKWQVGNSGRITPVASVAPVNVGGVVITSVSLHNMSLFEDLKLYQDCRVLISRRNDVIPYIERVLD